MIRTALTALLFALGTPALAQTAAPQGMVGDPCADVVPAPPAVTAHVASIYAPGRTGPVPPPPPEAAEYRKAQAEHAKHDWANLCRYRADNEALLAGPASGHRIVFMGDSITQNWLFADAALFTGGTVNRGISGQTSPQMLLRFMRDVVALQPQVVHIMAGTNDLAGNTGPSGAQDFRNNITAMVELAKANHIRVVLASIPPAAGFPWRPEVKPVLLGELNAWLKHYARKEGLVWVDYHSALRTPDGALKPELTFDGVHPSHAGYVVMAPLARAALAEAMKR